MSFLLPSVCASSPALAGSSPRLIRLFSHGLFAPGQGFLPEYTAGIHRNLVITRGLSNPAMVPRLFNPVEIVYITKKK
ncbi:MAG: hypothetical protein J6M64_08785 [Oscillospiraceae bacterium]|nr:hypothetical protein [Oscillospiraceae bacterium]